VTHTASTGGSGDYSDSLATKLRGAWRVQAHWDGDDTHLASDSPACTLTVGPG
jgi:hypothetical protein